MATFVTISDSHGALVEFLTVYCFYWMSSWLCPTT